MTAFGITLDVHWWWLILAAVLAAAEIVAPGVFLIWIAVAAAITGLVILAVDLSVAIQILLFAVLCLGSTWAGRRWYAGNPVASQDPNLNARTARLIGETVTVVEAITDGRGRVKVGDGVWPAKGADAGVGAKVRIAGADGSVLVVEPCPSTD